MLLLERWLVSIMLVSVTSEVAWVEIRVEPITRPTIRNKKRIKPKPIVTLQTLPSPLPPTLIPHPRNSHGAIFQW